MLSSAIFSKNKTQSPLITFQSLSMSGYYLKRCLRVLLPAILLMGMAVHNSGCAAQKCDCPKFGGHHLAH